MSDSNVTYIYIMDHDVLFKYKPKHIDVKYDGKIYYVI